MMRFGVVLPCGRKINGVFSFAGDDVMMSGFNCFEKNKNKWVMDVKSGCADEVD